MQFKQQASSEHSAFDDKEEDEEMNRKGEKIGWIGGWLGGFIWLALLSVAWLLHNKISEGLFGLVLLFVAVIVIFTTAPWKHPTAKYWKLMLPIYFLFFISIAICIFLYGGLERIGLTWTSFFWVIPCLIPIATIGNRTWDSNISGAN